MEHDSLDLHRGRSDSKKPDPYAASIEYSDQHAVPDRLKGSDRSDYCS